MALHAALKRTTALCVLAAVMAALPYTVKIGGESGFVAWPEPALAFAKGGDDDRDSDDDHDHDDDHDDDRDSDDDRDDDRSGRDDDRRGRDDDRRGRDRHDDDSHEARLSDGRRIEIENGRFEMKDASGRTIVERPATASDYELLNASTGGPSGGAGKAMPERKSTRGGGVVAKLEVYGDNIEITYKDGWKEEIENGRYELKDDKNRTVIQRPASASDRERLFAAVR